MLTHLWVTLKHLKMWFGRAWILLHDSVLAHHALLGQQQFAKHGTVVLPHAPYSPDLEPFLWLLGFK
jgi:hypothetical protein